MRSIYFTLLMLCTTTAVQASERAQSDIAIHPDLTGDAGILFWTPEQQVTGYSNIAGLYPTRAIQGRTVPADLPEKLITLDRFTYRLGWQKLTIADYMQKQHAAGLLVIHNGEVKVERYGLGHLPQKPWVSFSVTKSVVSMLYGAAIKDGFIESLDTPISTYLPVFATGSYAGVTIKNILQMASGVAWNEDYADYETASWLAAPVAGTGETLAELASELELPDAALAQTVETYNQAAASGHDGKFHKSKDWLKPLIGPFVALDCTPGNGAFFPHFTLGGLDTTVDGQVLTSQGEVIPGLYAAGRTACGVPRRGDGYASGSSVGDATFSGRRAGRQAAAA